MDFGAAGRHTAAATLEDGMVSLDDYIDDDDEPDVAADFAALRGCLQALADAIASTNLAVINGAQGDVQAATQRVQASIGALKRFHEAFAVLKSDDGEEAPEEADDED